MVDCTEITRAGVNPPSFHSFTSLFFLSECPVLSHRKGGMVQTVKNLSGK